jgi:hypothetical protein
MYSSLGSSPLKKNKVGFENKYSGHSAIDSWAQCYRVKLLCSFTKRSKFSKINCYKKIAGGNEIKIKI